MNEKENIGLPTKEEYENQASLWTMVDNLVYAIMAAPDEQYSHLMHSDIYCEILLRDFLLILDNHLSKFGEGNEMVMRIKYDIELEINTYLYYDNVDFAKYCRDFFIMLSNGRPTPLAYDFIKKTIDRQQAIKQLEG